MEPDIDYYTAAIEISRTSGRHAVRYLIKSGEESREIENSDFIAIQLFHIAEQATKLANLADTLQMLVAFVTGRAVDALRKAQDNQSKEERPTDEPAWMKDLVASMGVGGKPNGDSEDPQG